MNLATPAVIGGGFDFDLSTSTIDLTLNRYIIEIMNKEKTVRNKGIVDLVQKGLSYSEIANIYKVSKARVHQIFRKARPKQKDLSPEIDLMDF